MDATVGRFNAQVERPEPIKFAWPIVILPELFTTHIHLALLTGYLASVGWEVYVPDLRAAMGRDGAPVLGRIGCAGMVALIDELLAALGRDALVMGHGVGGLIALKMAERPHVRAAIALAPAVPGRPSRLAPRLRGRFATWRGRPINPPRGRLRADFLSDADAFQRDRLAHAMVSDAGVIAREVARGEFTLARFADAAPRMIIAGEMDPFAPIERVRDLAGAIGARFAMLPSRGHWLIAGHALERAIGETQRFAVRTLGQDLLLLHPDEAKDPPNG
ncbi:MAG TPA: alpha/beta fold hydrolase [Candidatus Binataceae bacterium]|nr:alpha/beta fold hydrolase [Candidatus Binataceae bacterium]